MSGYLDVTTIAAYSVAIPAGSDGRATTASIVDESAPLAYGLLMGVLGVRSRWA